VKSHLSKSSMRRHHAWLALVQRIFDALLVFMVLMALSYYVLQDFAKDYQLLAVLGSLLTWIAMGAVDAYRAWRGSSLWQELQVLMLGWLAVIFILVMLAWSLQYGERFSRVVVGLWFGCSALGFMLSHTLQRLLLRWMRSNGKNSRQVIIVGAGDLGKQLAERIQGAEWMGMNLVGLFDDDVTKLGSVVHGAPVLGDTSDVYNYVVSQNIDQVYLALPMRNEKVMRGIFDELQDSTASIFLVPDLFIFELMGAREQDVGGIPAFALCETPLTGPFGLIKRLEDIVVSSAILLLISPLLLLISIAIKLTSSGPVIFKQHRYGLNGEYIKVYKFRSMTVCDNDATVIKQASKGDARITPLGAFLRKTSLDELPQFVNVLQGRMSVVGPRPHAVAHNEEYRKLIKGYMWRHKMKPGITGWAQINGWRGETDTLEKMEKRVEYDLDYIRRWSVGFDIKIIFMTIFKGFIDKNAY